VAFKLRRVLLLRNKRSKGSFTFRKPDWFIVCVLPDFGALSHRCFLNNGKQDPLDAAVDLTEGVFGKVPDVEVT
jgi:hypothetical protein